MTARLFSLRDVPEDEAAEVRTLLAEHGFDFYETAGGNWGISAPALWLRDESRLAEARRVLDDYQAKRRERVRAEYNSLRQAGSQRTVLDVVRENPVRFIAYLLAILVILYFSTKPFLDFGK